MPHSRRALGGPARARRPGGDQRRRADVPARADRDRRARARAARALREADRPQRRAGGGDGRGGAHRRARARGRVQPPPPRRRPEAARADRGGPARAARTTRRRGGCGAPASRRSARGSRSPSLAGGGPLVDIGVHVLDYALFLLGNPAVKSVSASTYDLLGANGFGGSPESTKSGADGDGKFDVEDLATVFMRLQDGGTLLLEASWAMHRADGDQFGADAVRHRGRRGVVRRRLRAGRLAEAVRRHRRARHGAVLPRRHRRRARRGRRRLRRRDPLGRLGGARRQRRRGARARRRRRVRVRPRAARDRTCEVRRPRRGRDRRRDRRRPAPRRARRDADRARAGGRGAAVDGADAADAGRRRGAAGPGRHRARTCATATW